MIRKFSSTASMVKNGMVKNMLLNAIETPEFRDMFIIRRLMLYSDIFNFHRANIKEQMPAKNLHHLLRGRFAIQKYILMGEFCLGDFETAQKFETMMSTPFSCKSKFENRYLDIVIGETGMEDFARLNYHMDSYILDAPDEKKFFRGAKMVDRMVMNKLAEDVWNMSTVDEKIKMFLDEMK